jgi:hypothetical protein
MPALAPTLVPAVSDRGAGWRSAHRASTARLHAVSYRHSGGLQEADDVAVGLLHRGEQLAATNIPHRVLDGGASGGPARDLQRPPERLISPARDSPAMECLRA